MTGLSRRSFVIGGASLLALAACADDEDDSASSSLDEPETSASPSASATAADGPWEYTDDLAEKISLDRRPTTILAYSSSGAVLWDLGIQVDGTMGPLKNADGTAVKSAGRMDVGSITDVGQEEVDLEKIAALRPDIIVLQVNSGELDYYPLTEEQLDSTRKLAPLVGVRAYGAGADEVISNYERLAEALGSDQSVPELVREKDRLTAAQDKLKETLAGKSGLKAAFVNGAEEELYVAIPASFPDVVAYGNLGLEIVDPDTDEDYFQTLSWENADTYPVDLLLLDERGLSSEALEADQPTWRNLPAVKAGQVAAWNGEVVLSPRGFADAVEALDAVVANADPGIVS